VRWVGHILVFHQYIRHRSSSLRDGRTMADLDRALEVLVAVFHCRDRRVRRLARRERFGPGSWGGWLCRWCGDAVSVDDRQKFRPQKGAHIFDARMSLTRGTRQSKMFCMMGEWNIERSCLIEEEQLVSFVFMLVSATRIQ